MFKTIEDIRKEQNMTKVQLAQFIGLSVRALERRKERENPPNWWLDEIVKIANLNDGKVIVDTHEGKYKIQIKKV